MSKSTVCKPMAHDEVERLRAVCNQAAEDLLAVIIRDDGQLRGAAAGDVDNVRLTLWQAGGCKRGAPIDLIASLIR